MSRNPYKIAAGAGVLALAFSLLAYFTMVGRDYPVWSPGALFHSSAEADHFDNQVFTIKDSNNTLLSEMSRTVQVGDELLKPDGRRYRVTTVNNFDARAEFTGMDRDFLALRDEYNGLTLPATAGKTVARAWQTRPIAIYHTHSAESYVPTDGTDSQPYHGGIFKVGDVFASALRKSGVKVIHDKTPHEPRDTNAYYRSRRTAVKLLKQNPVALIDVHRDGIPDPNYYIKNIDGSEVTQLRLVVGRQNPKMHSNMEFAKKVMAAADKIYPNIVKEIFIAHGNYNQDLLSTAMLIEVGTHTDSRVEAEKGATMFADALPTILGMTGTIPGNEGPAGGAGPAAQTPGAWKNVAWLLGILILGSGAFLLISAGSWDKARQRLRSFWRQEVSIGSPAKKPGANDRKKPNDKE
ncbi:MAG: stage II sporulation protein P [Firmicutes bacterium]|nr:stage II sporulation protein P [Bacillota bacterium]